MPTNKLIRIGTRNSALAMWQARHIASLLEAAGYSVEIIDIVTIGDKILDRSLSKIGAKGVFTEELETMLRNGEIDIAQHSAKDLPSTLAADLPLIAFTKREAAHDVVLSLNPDFRLAEEGAIVGTSSTRRRALLAKEYPQHTLVEMRGNLQTRLEKLKSGACDAMILAYAGVHRMGMESYIVEHLPIDTFTPAVGQGSVAIQSSSQLDPVLAIAIRQLCNNEPTEACLLAERHLLAQLDGGCSVPVFGHAKQHADGLHLQAGVLGLQGEVELKATGIGTDPETLGKAVAQDLIAQGAQTLLQDIRKQLAS
ncbi:MAG: hydroxymethylbilane synthase [Cytophagaceae bacterium]|nr:hydroxymethylbilane synthase [Cytophagaceae bacterium]MBP6092791.1 hydroxymethylbilane synthase [Cytophagaceae bacterium]